MARDVFISYKTEDKEVATRLCAALERENISCWIAPRDIGIGREWAAAIVDGLQRSKSFVLVLSSNSKNARQISREAEIADRAGLPIITFRIEDVQPPAELLYFLGNIQWLDAFGGQFDSALARLVNVVRESASYPAEKTEVRNAPAKPIAPKTQTDEPTTEPSPAPPPDSTPHFSPVPPPVVSFERPTERSNSVRWVAIGAVGVIVLIIAVWLLTRHPHPRPSPLTVAERFIRERTSGYFQTAWAETVPGFNDGVTQEDWMATTENDVRRNGKAKRVSGDCQPDGSDYNCRFTVSFENGHSSDYTIKLKTRDDGS
ncbi:MAG: TIR domain-containing protein, partial [Acidobacteriaceae bacterium]|nr:TIR domain-containing protein [Acidobacteriaceae bacterium]